MLFTTLFMCVLGVVLHFAVKKIIHEETDEKLSKTAELIMDQLEQSKNLLSLGTYLEVDSVPKRQEQWTFSDTLIADEDEELEEFRQLVVFNTVDGQTFRIVTRESFLESKDLIETLSYIIAIALLSLLLILFVVNRFVAKSIWSPFYINLNRLQQFSLKDKEHFKPFATNIKEFNVLNEVIIELTDKIVQDYESLKKFSEDASHELQTPLAVIRAKIESLINNEDLSLSQTEKLKDINTAVNKLTRINKGLILLTKIENQQYQEVEKINVNELLQEKVLYFEELVVAKNLEFRIENRGKWELNSNRMLLDLLFNNLIGNALNYSPGGSTIQLVLDYGKFEISNPGENAINDENRLFERFYKGNNSSSVGLGLAIVDQICKISHMSLSYNFEDKQHIFTVRENL